MNIQTPITPKIKAIFFFNPHVAKEHMSYRIHNRVTLRLQNRIKDLSLFSRARVEMTIRLSIKDELRIVFPPHIYLYGPIYITHRISITR